MTSLVRMQLFIILALELLRELFQPYTDCGWILNERSFGRSCGLYACSSQLLLNSSHCVCSTEQHCLFSWGLSSFLQNVHIGLFVIECFCRFMPFYHCSVDIGEKNHIILTDIGEKGHFCVLFLLQKI